MAGTGGIIKDISRGEDKKRTGRKCYVKPNKGISFKKWDLVKSVKYWGVVKHKDWK